MFYDIKENFYNFCKKYVHLLAFFYYIFYLQWFTYLEKFFNNLDNVYIIDFTPDKYVPFIEIFIIPYFLWFFYVFFAMIFFAIVDKAEFLKFCLILYFGMTVALIIYTILPNGHNLRPVYFERDNIFIDWIKYLYASDTSTNVLPSIHTFNSIAVHYMIITSKHIKSFIIKVLSAVLMVLIVLSTIFLKQHSILDVISAIILFFVIIAVCNFKDFKNTKNKDEFMKDYQL